MPASVTSSTVNAANRLTNWNGQAISYDANCNMSNDGVNTYVWNARNQLTQIKNTSGTVVASFSYDPQGRRSGKNVNGTVRNFLYDGANIVQEQDSSKALVAGYLTGGVDEIFAQQSAGQTNGYLTDALDSTIRLTNGSGAKLVDYTYDPYGNTTADATVANPFQYTGRENDGNGLYYYRARHYSPQLQRFISKDPIKLAGGINTYSYVGEIRFRLLIRLVLIVGAATVMDVMFRLPIHHRPFGKD